MYDSAAPTIRHLLNAAMFTWFEVDSRDDGPTRNGWTPQQPLVEKAELSEVVDAVLTYHPDSSLAATNDGAHTATTGATIPAAYLGGLGRFMRTKPADIEMTTPRHPKRAQIAHGDRNDGRHHART
jgi:hypothetical protein